MLIAACNFIVPSPDGQFMLKNYGAAVNCSAMIMYPIQLKVSYLDVGVTQKGAEPDYGLATPNDKVRLGKF